VTSNFSQGSSMKHPLLSLSARSRPWLAGISLTITILGLIVLGLTDPGRMTGRDASIVSFELAGCESKAVAILDTWGELGARAAAFNLGFDYLFLVGYSTFMTLMCLWASRRYSNPSLRSLGVLLAWQQWIAGLLDCAEDAALLKILFHGASDGAAEIACACAIGKFGLVSCGVVYTLASLPATGRVREAS
jgi:hypothetical protein